MRTKDLPILTGLPVNAAICALRNFLLMHALMLLPLNGGLSMRAVLTRPFGEKVTET